MTLAKSPKQFLLEVAEAEEFKRSKRLAAAELWSCTRHVLQVRGADPALAARDLAERARVAAVAMRDRLGISKAMFEDIVPILSEVDGLCLWALQQARDGILVLMSDPENDHACESVVGRWEAALRELSEMGGESLLLYFFEHASDAIWKWDGRQAVDLPAKEREILVAMLDLDATDQERRRKRSAIAQRAWGEKKEVKRQMKELIDRGLAGSLDGQGGGYWLTERGRTVAEGLRAAP